MGKKYLDTKTGSIEQSILDVWNEAAQVNEKELTAKQKKIDMNKDGKIGGDDLAKLRKKGDKDEGYEEESFKANENKFKNTKKSWEEALKKVKEDSKVKKETSTITGKKPAEVELNPKDEDGKK
tara:strand:+ start:740 stop:1111 length:372 start_codon:yes stop_codon:yes gene_type:complete